MLKVLESIIFQCDIV